MSSYWLDDEPPAFQKHRHSGRVDVAIVGADVTGCACALTLADAGLRVRVHEAREADVRADPDFPGDLPHFRKAREIPLSDLPRRYRELTAWKKQPILIFSRDGVDAASACEFLARQGFPYVSHVFGGVEAWVHGGYGRSTASQ